MATPKSKDALDELRDATKRAMDEHYYGDYILAVVRTVLFKNKAIMNPSEESELMRGGE